jgi:hypothetical protein
LHYNNQQAGLYESGEAVGLVSIYIGTAARATRAVSSADDAAGAWFQTAFPRPVSVRRYGWTVAPVDAPAAWTLFGSATAYPGTWSVLDKRTLTSGGAAGAAALFTVTTQPAQPGLRFYRMAVTGVALPSDAGTNGLGFSATQGTVFVNGPLVFVTDDAVRFAAPLAENLAYSVGTAWSVPALSTSVYWSAAAAGYVPLAQGTAAASPLTGYMTVFDRPAGRSAGEDGYDAAGAGGAATVGWSNYRMTTASVAVADRTPPHLCGALLLTQGAGTGVYTFSTSAGGALDSGVFAVEMLGGGLTAGLLLSTSDAMSEAAVVAQWGSANVVKSGTVAQTAGAPAQLPALTSAALYFDGAASWVAISDRYASTPLYGYLAACDSTGANYAVFKTAAATAVQDRTAPLPTGTPAMTQAAGEAYTWTLTAGSVTFAEWRSPTVRAALILSGTNAMTAAGLAALYAAAGASTANVTKLSIGNGTALAYGASVAVPSMTSTATWYDTNASAWKPVTDATVGVYAYVLLLDDSDNPDRAASALVPVLDRTLPVAAGGGFAATQNSVATNSGVYAFTYASGATLLDKRGGTMYAGLLLSTQSGLTGATLDALYNAYNTTYIAKSTFANATPGSAIAVPAMTTASSPSYYWNSATATGSWVAVTDSTASATLYPYLILYDANGPTYASGGAAGAGPNYASLVGASVAVADVTPPSLSGTPTMT